MSRLEIVERESRAAEAKLSDAVKVFMAAKQEYDDEPDRIHRINLKAAIRLVKETRAMAEEWVL